MSAAETVALPARGGDRKAGKNGQTSTITFTTFSAERKSGAADAKVSPAGTAAADPEARLPAAEASNSLRSGDRTFVGQP